MTCKSDPDNTSFAGCMAHEWTFNPQASLSYLLSPVDTIFATVSDRGRFPLLKESYTYSLGRGIANPDLKPEHNTAFNVGYSHAFAGKTVAQFEFFFNRLRNAIQSVYVVDPGGTSDPLCSNTGTTAGYCSQNVNIGKEVHRGLEISIRSTPVSRLTLDAQYSYLFRSLEYNFGDNLDVSQVLSTVQICRPTQWISSLQTQPSDCRGNTGNRQRPVRAASECRIQPIGQPPATCRSMSSTEPWISERLFLFMPA